nr:glycogen/starch/alpha-glucan phosphorylase [Akkermansiaceae bacterium]
RERVGADNFFQFGLTEEEIEDHKARGYRPADHYESNAELRESLDLINSGFFTPDDPGLFHPLVNSLLHHDPYMLLADYESYVKCQEDVAQTYRDQDRWTGMSILNVARCGYFSSDRAIREYGEHVWNVKPEPIDSKGHTG